MKEAWDSVSIQELANLFVSMHSDRCQAMIDVNFKDLVVGRIVSFIDLIV